jgi:hypothetical protein
MMHLDTERTNILTLMGNWRSEEVANEKGSMGHYKQYSAGRCMRVAYRYENIGGLCDRDGQNVGQAGSFR